MRILLVSPSIEDAHRSPDEDSHYPIKALEEAGGQLTDDFWMTDTPMPYYTAENSYEKLLEMKEKLRRHIALEKITTPEGFEAQKHLLPQIIKYSYQFGMFGIVRLVEQIIQKKSVERLQFLKEVFENNWENAIIKTVTKEMEEIIRRDVRKQ